MGSLISLNTYFEETYEWDTKQIHRKYLLTQQIEQSKNIKLKQVEQSNKNKLKQLKRIKYIL